MRALPLLALLAACSAPTGGGDMAPSDGSPACAAPCPAGYACVDGRCQTVDTGCPAPQTQCHPATGSPYCADFASDAENCGRCGFRCAGMFVCRGGSCGCPDATTLCGGACVATASDAANCGA